MPRMPSIILFESPRRLRLIFVHVQYAIMNLLEVSGRNFLHEQVSGDDGTGKPQDEHRYQDEDGYYHHEKSTIPAHPTTFRRSTTSVTETTNVTPTTTTVTIILPRVSHAVETDHTYKKQQPPSRNY